MTNELYYKPIFSFVIGVFLFFFLQSRRERKKRILNNCKEIKGTVVNQELEYNNSGQRVYFPIIQFDVENESILERYPDGYFPARYAMGQEIVIQYSLSNPKEFLIKDDRTNWIEFGILLAGIVFLIYSACLFYQIYYA